MAEDNISYSARDIMSAPVITIGQGAAVSEAAAIMLERGFGGLPVVDENGDYMGLVTENWFMPRQSGYPMMRGTTFRLLGELVGDLDDIGATMKKVRDLRVGDVMELNSSWRRRIRPSGTCWTS